MNVHPSVGREVAKGAGRLMVHLFAIVVGVILMIVGLAMGVSVALLPIGIPVGLAGLLLFVWGFFGKAEEKKMSGPPPQP